MKKNNKKKTVKNSGRIDDSQPQQQDDRSDDNSENETNEPIDIDNTLDLLLEPEYFYFDFDVFFLTKHF